MNSTRFAAAMLGTATLVGAGWVSAQSAQNPAPGRTVISGDDIGFRVEGYADGRPIGTLVVRVNGVWMEADYAPRHRTMPATK